MIPLNALVPEDARTNIGQRTTASVVSQILPRNSSALHGIRNGALEQTYGARTRAYSGGDGGAVKTAASAPGA